MKAGQPPQAGPPVWGGHPGHAEPLGEEVKSRAWHPGLLQSQPQPESRSPVQVAHTEPFAARLHHEVLSDRPGRDGHQGRSTEVPPGQGRHSCNGGLGQRDLQPSSRPPATQQTMPCSPGALHVATLLPDSPQDLSVPGVSSAMGAAGPPTSHHGLEVELMLSKEGRRPRGEDSCPCPL